MGDFYLEMHKLILQFLSVSVRCLFNGLKC